MDPIADFLTRIKNGYRAKKSSVIIPYSRIKDDMVRILEARNFIAGVEKKGRKVRKFLEVKLRYENSSPALSNARRVSRPSRRLYLRRGEIRPVRQGFGIAIISTSRGLMTGDEAKKAGLGGEIIAEVW